MKSEQNGLQRGSQFRIEALSEPYSFISQRLLTMGLVRGALIEVANIAPFGGPVEIKCKGYNLSLRKDELSRLELSPT